MNNAKDLVKDRIDILRICLGPVLDEMGYAADSLERHMLNELQFLEKLLDTLERS